MKVKLQKGNDMIIGELISSHEDRVNFFSNKSEFWICLIQAKISICGKEDDNAIWVKGYEADKDDPDIFRKADYIFLPYNEQV
jgi:hypothetical protein